MGEVVNLNRYRKQKQRAERERRAEANRARFGISKSERGKTSAERALDAANRKRAQEELISQAKGATPMRLAQGAARAAVEQSFGMPLKAAGIDARVTARFADAPAG